MTGCPGTPAVVWALAAFGGVGAVLLVTVLYQLAFEAWERRR